MDWYATTRSLMRPAAGLCLLAVLSSSQDANALAGIIKLKNGRTISVDTVREDGDRVVYTIGDNEFKLRRTAVDTIQDGVAGLSASVAPAAVLESVAGPRAAAPKETNDVIKNDSVDEEALQRIQASGSPARIASAYYAAGYTMYGKQQYERARQYWEIALRSEPDHDASLSGMAAALIQMGRFAQATTFAERAARKAPQSVDAQFMLGYTYLQSGKPKEAFAALDRAAQLSPSSENIRKYRDQAKRELDTESNYTQDESSQFKLRYEGGQVSAFLRGEILQTLERHYNDLVREFGVAPKDTISVTLYTEQAFFDVTQVPAWTAAVNDGRLKLPISGVTRMTPQLDRVLRHELAHTFVNSIAKGRCPQWLNEGIAQLMEQRSWKGYTRLVQNAIQQGTFPSLNQLEGSFMGMNDEAATRAYLHSLLVTEYIRDIYGTSDLVRVLQRIGEGMGTEAALRATIKTGYRDLEQEAARYATR